jgi:hypothetical protein
MNEDSSDFFDDSEWEDIPEPIWQEFDWQRYLNESDGEIERFLQLYEASKPIHERLDQVASQMGWDSSDWSIEDRTPSQGPTELDTSIPEAERRDLADFEPYTVHQHPIYIATRALFLMVRRGWESLLCAGLAPADAKLSWMLGRALHEGEVSGLLATQAVELGDVELAVCHFKRSLFEINRVLAILPDHNLVRSKVVRLFDRSAKSALFDLREIALRVIYECREEARRRPGDSD